MTCFQVAGPSGKYLVSGSSSPIFAFFDEHHDCGGGELLAYRSGLKDRFQA